MIAKLIKYQKITLLFFVVLVLLGAFSFLSLSQRENPEITVSMATVKTIYPGASPEKVEQLVTKPLEEEIRKMESIKSIDSTSSTNVSFITVEMQPGVDNERAWDTLRQKVQSAQGKLPAEAYQPEINDDLAKTSAQIIHLIVESPSELESLRPISETWKDQLRTVAGVSDVEIVGLPDQEVKVIMNKEKLESLQLPWPLVMQALTTAHDRTPIGNVVANNNNTYVQLTGEWKSAKDIADTVVYRPSGQGNSLSIKDVAEVKIGPQKTEEEVLYQGKPAVDVVIYPAKGQNIPSLQAGIDVKVSELQSQLPSHVTMVSLFTQKENVDHLFADLSREMLIGMAAVLVVCILGLAFGTSIIVALAIPVSIALGFLPIGMTSIDLNQISIVALVIVLGILVDDAIVVNDNIERRLSLGDSPLDASLKGSQEVAISILTATIATAAAFFPLFFLKGNIGDFIKPIPVVVSLTLAASMAMSLTIIPIFRKWSSERSLRKGVSAQNKLPGLLGKPIWLLSEYYEKLIRRLLRKPLLTGMIGLVIGTASYGLLPLLGVQYFPSAERSEFLLDVKMPVSADYKQTADMMKSLSVWAAKQDGVQSVSAYAGRTTPKFYYAETDSVGTRIGQLYVKVDESRSHTGKLVSDWREQLKHIYPDIELLPRELEQGPPVGAPIAVRISGPDLNELTSLSKQLQTMLKSIPGTTNVSDSVGDETFTMDLQLDQEKARYYGVTEKDLSGTARLATDGIEVSKLQLGSEDIPVTLFSEANQTPSNETIGELLVPSQSGQLYPVKQFINVQSDRMITSVQHRNLVRTITVRAYTDGRLPADIVAELQQQVSKLQKPNAYTIEFAGENADRNDAFSSIGKLSIVVVCLIFIIIAIQFYSLSIPFLVMMTVYLAMGGALIGLFVTGAPIGFMALMGFVSLAGIVVRNGIVLVEFIEDARHHGMELYDAIAESGRARLRPILMTSATAISGLLPMAIMGGSLWRPMAVVIISGLIVSTILTLIIVPSFYLRLALWRDKRKLKRNAAAVTNLPAHGETTSL
ncbi:efflux RND transporter permease subunit [Paenibacillus aceris]|uniref:Multidrug efflux pump subunit AcrB n=1 Tax=Paenibacillus aceris TaxID=869555 RepID=A0ABS4I2K0_9BACL|nr:efflux RND transporter permease subunit [Paenibacillus aceris]MBP1965102.1 multidrug efflux pump subunit AcrB [Paenibacillus aceris]NHW33085.1 efflux RND transporter permease subunit [Paenibacillus aceris]